ncbi:hypothetical protein KKC32_03300 [Patescibacteria group bacterium]|nr:hypothetical protein [Patescibacteria group bacterium]
MRVLAIFLAIFFLSGCYNVRFMQVKEPSQRGVYHSETRRSGAVVRKTVPHGAKYHWKRMAYKSMPSVVSPGWYKLEKKKQEAKKRRQANAKRARRR